MTIVVREGFLRGLVNPLCACRTWFLRTSGNPARFFAAA